MEPDMKPDSDCRRPYPVLDPDGLPVSGFPVSIIQLGYGHPFTGRDVEELSAVEINSHVL